MSNELDKQFSDRLIGYESTVDAEALWQAVKPPRRKRPLAWLWLLVGTIGLLTAAWWYLGASEDTTASLESNVPVAAHVTENKPNLSTKDEIVIEQHQEEHALTFNPIEVNTKAGKDEGINTRSSVSTAPAAKKTITDTHEITPQPTTLQVSKNDRLAIETKFADNTAESSLENQSSLREDSREDLSLYPDENKEENTLEDALHLTKVSRERTIFASTALLPALDLKLLSPDSKIPTPTLASIFSAKPVAPRRSSPWFIQVDAGYYQLDRTLTSNDSLTTTLVNQREQTETPLEATSLDLTLGYTLNKNWELRSGLGYTQINTAFDYINETTSIDSVEGLQAIVYQSPTEVDSIYGLVARYSTTTRVKRTYNSFRQWELPVLVAYNFGARKLHYQAEAGLRLLLTRQWEGTVMSADREFMNLETTDWYRSSLGLSVQAGFKAVYDLSGQTALMAGISARYNPQQMTTTDARFNERYQLLGVTLGLRHRF